MTNETVQPTSKAPVARVIADDTVLESVEHRYEGTAALVYERRDGWYRVGYRDEDHRTAWLAPEDAGRFTNLDDLLRDRLIYMTETWDRRLYRRPEIGGDNQLIEKNLEKDHRTDAELVKLGEVGKDRWAMVVILREGERCAAEHGVETVVAAGWVPVFDVNGKPNIWFFARGC